MIKQQHEKFMRAETRRIERAKWMMGEKVRRDPGDPYVLEWIKKNGAEFRRVWNLSKCCACTNSDKCGHEVRLICEDFEIDPMVALMLPQDITPPLSAAENN